MDDRAKARDSINRLNDLAAQAQRSAERGLILPEITEKGIIQITGVSERSRQVDALSALGQELQKRHLDRLLPLAQNEFNAFCEYVSPDEPPASAWHIWLTNKLQEIEFDPDLGRFILNCPPGHAKPLHVDTPVLMADGIWKRLGSIKVGDRVLSDTGTPRIVEAVHDQGELPLLKIVTAKGREILSAYDHSFRVLKDGKAIWTTAENLRPGDTLDVVGRPNDKHPQEDHSNFSTDLFRLSAYFGALGAYTLTTRPSGTSSKNYQLWFSDENHCEAVKQICDRLEVGYAVHWVPANGRWLLRLKTGGAARFEKALMVTQKAGDRRVPAWVFQGSDAKVKAFLTTFLRVRGRTPPKDRRAAVQIRIKSPDYAADIQKLFARLNIDSRIEPGEHTTLIEVASEAMETLLEAGLTFPGAGTAAFDAKRATSSSHPTDRVTTIETAGAGPCKCLTVKTDHTLSLIHI